MGRPRLVDYDEVRRLYVTGEFTYQDLANRFGVSTFPIQRAVRPETAEKQARWHQQHKVPCAAGCGRMVYRDWYGGERLCRSCWADEIRTSVQPGALRCVVCKVWKPDDAFPCSRAEPHRRGRHSNCRACQASVRQASRLNRRVPCANCGKPRLHPNDSRPGKPSTGLCRVCYIESVRKPESTEAS